MEEMGRQMDNSHPQSFFKQEQELAKKIFLKVESTRVAEELKVLVEREVLNYLKDFDPDELVINMQILINIEEKEAEEESEIILA